MKVYILFLVLVTFLSSNLCLQGPENSTLELVQVIFRHGARTPLKHKFELFHFHDISEYEPFGLDALTDKGKEQEYEMGLFLRNRYGDFLGAEYKKEHVYALASDFERTKMSLELVLAGLYPPTNHSGSKLAKLGWQPIPYSYIPKKLDTLLRPWDSMKYRKLNIEAMNSKGFLYDEGVFSGFLNHLMNISGIHNVTNTRMAAKLYDVLLWDEQLNFTMPMWYSEVVKRKLAECFEFDINSLFLTEEMTRMIGGPIIKAFIDNMNLNNTDYNPRKIYLYSGHDYNLNGVTRAHGIYDEFKIAPVGSAFIFEKFRGATNDVFVRLLAWGGSGDPIVLKLGNHENFCPIEDYLRLVRNMIPSDTEMYSHLQNVDPKILKNLFFAETYKL